MQILLFRRHHFPLYGFLVVGSPTCRTQTVHVVLDIVEAELTDLGSLLAASIGVKRTASVGTYLVSARTWSKVPVGEIQLLDTQRAKEQRVSLRDRNSSR